MSSRKVAESERRMAASKISGVDLASKSGAIWARVNLSPIEISVALAVIGLAAIACIVLWGAANGWPLPWVWMLVAAVCVQGRLMCNLLDGIVAIEGGRKAKGGDIFNEVPDRIEDTLFFTGAGYACGQVELGWACAVLAVFTAYLRAFGASLGLGQDFGGPCAKQQRMAILTAGLVGGALGAMFRLDWNILATALQLVAIGTSITAVLRLARMYRKAP